MACVESDIMNAQNLTDVFNAKLNSDDLQQGHVIRMVVLDNGRGKVIRSNYNPFGKAHESVLIQFNTFDEAVRKLREI